VALGPGDGVEESLASAVVVRDALQRLLDPQGLPRVLHEEDVQQQVDVGPQLVRVGDSDLPEQLVEDGVRKVGVLPAQELQQLLGVVLRSRYL
jgi:hypothetical protein